MQTLKIGLEGEKKYWDRIDRQQLKRTLNSIVQKFAETMYDDVVVITENDRTMWEVYKLGLPAVVDRDKLRDVDVRINVRDI